MVGEGPCPRLPAEPNSVPDINGVAYDMSMGANWDYDMSQGAGIVTGGNLVVN
jgi:hypothetical protein